MESIVMEERDALVRQIRPEPLRERNANNALEAFQNKTIKPIVDLQSDLVIAQFKEYLQKHKTRFYSFNREGQREMVRDIMQTDLSIRNLLVPMVTGLFTLQEFHYFSTHRAQVARRIQNLIIRSLQERVDALY